MSGHNDPRATNESPIAHRRRELGMTQAQLAKLLGVRTEQVSRWETGARPINLTDLTRIADALDCTIHDLVSDYWLTTR